MTDFKIIEFKDIYKYQVINLITEVLKDQNVISKDSDLITDADLQKISEIYSGRGRFFIAISGNDLIGTAAIREIDITTAKLKRMFVVTKYHGLGVGQALLDHAIKFAKSNGYKEIILNTHLVMKRAHHFYEKNSFIKTCEDEVKYSYKLIIDSGLGQNDGGSRMTGLHPVIEL